MKKQTWYKKICDVFRQISRRRLKSFMTMFSISIATVTILLVVSSNSYLNTSLDKQLGTLSKLSVTYDADTSNNGYGITSSDKNLVQKIKGVKSVSLHNEGLYRQLPVSILGRESQRSVRSLNEVRINSKLSLLKGTQKSLLKGSVNDALVSDELAYQLLKDKNSITTIIGKKIYFGSKKLSIVGVYYTTSDTSLLPDIVVSQSFIDSVQKKSYDTMTVSTRDKNNTKIIYDLADKLNQKGENKSNGRYSVINNKKALDESKSAATAGQFMFVMIGSVSLFVAGFGVMNALYASISERKKEIAIRRALGATKADIQWSFQIEGTLLTGIGSILGIFMSLMISTTGKMFNVNMTISLSSIIISFVMSLTVGLLFSYIPAIKASTQNVIEGLND